MITSKNLKLRIKQVEYETCETDETRNDEICEFRSQTGKTPTFKITSHSVRQQLSSASPSFLQKIQEMVVDNSNTNAEVVSELAEAPVTYKRPVAQKVDLVLPNSAEARANTAPDMFHPEGTTNHPDKNSKQRTVLQQHCDYFDLNHDGVITMSETFQAFRKLGFNYFMCILAIMVIHPRKSCP